MHTVNHAFFKALLFLGAGAVIHSFSEEQDVRKMGGLIKFLPFTFSVMLVGTLSLLAIPFLTGFFSKDLIIELSFAQYSFSGIYAFILGSLTAGLTAFYSFRLIFLVFLTIPNGPKLSYLNSHEANLAVIIPLFLLSLFSIFFGYLASDLYTGLGSNFLGNSIFMHPNNIFIIEAEFSLSSIIKLLPLILTIIGSLTAVLLYSFFPYILVDITDLSIGRKLYSFLNGKYYFDVIYNHYIITTGLNLSYNISKYLDRGVIELVGPYGVSSSFTNLGVKISKLDDGSITSYGLYIILSAIFFIYFIYFSLLTSSDIINFRFLIFMLFSVIIVFATNEKKQTINPLSYKNVKKKSNINVSTWPLLGAKYENLKNEKESVRNYNSLVKQTNNHPESQYIPWIITPSGLKAYAKIVDLYNFILDHYSNKPIADFVKTECDFLVKHVSNDNPYFFGKLNTGYSNKTFDYNNMINTKKVLSYSQWTEFSKIKTAGDLNKSWVYCFFELNNLENGITKSNISEFRMNIGSTISPINRMTTYIKSCLKTLSLNDNSLTSTQLRILYRENNISKEMLFEGYKKFFFFVGIEGINFVNLWHNKYPNLSLDTKSYFILKSFTEFYIRTLEQAMISYYKPEINDDRIVSYDFSNVNINEFKGISNNFVESYDEQGNLYKTFNSYQEACTQLGITRNKLEYNLNVIDKYVFSPVANKNLQIICRNREIRLKPNVHKSQITPEITGVDFNSLDLGFFYLILQDKKTIIGKFRTLNELVKKTGLQIDNVRYRNKEITIKISTSSLELDSNLKLIVNNLEVKGKLEVYLVSAQDVTKNLLRLQEIQKEKVVSFDLKDKFKVRFHNTPKEAFLELKLLTEMKELYKGKKIGYSHFIVYYLSGLGGDLDKKRIFLNRFWLIWEKDYDPAISTPSIPLKTIKFSERRYRHVSELVSVDLLENMKIRYHSNIEKAFHELCDIMGLDPSKTKNNISNYLLPPKPRYKSRFKLYWKDEFKAS